MFVINILKRIQGRVFGIFEKRYMKQARTRLVNENFTLLTNNCLGGVAYHLLAKKFDSPTINTYIKNPDFCMLCSDIDYYFNEELEFFKSNERPCPCAYLGRGDKRIVIQFEHYNTEEEAAKKWNERKRRIHRENLYLILNDGNGLTVDDTKLLENVKCKRKIVFTSREKPEISDSFVLRTLKKYETAVFVQTDRHFFTGLRPWQREFDIVAWLNGEQEFRC